jgi:hypothetical protein
MVVPLKYLNFEAAPVGKERSKFSFNISFSKGFQRNVWVLFNNTRTIAINLVGKLSEVAVS